MTNKSTALALVGVVALLPTRELMGMPRTRTSGRSATLMRRCAGAAAYNHGGACQRREAHATRAGCGVPNARCSRGPGDLARLQARRSRGSKSLFAWISPPDES